jgi:Family of unknown function (DUF5694)
MKQLGSVLIALAFAGAGAAETPAFDPRSWKGQHAGPPSQVLTVGSTHLGQIKVVVTPEMLAPLLGKLSAFKPDIITHEGRSGEQCEVLKRYAARYPGMFDTYCFDAAEAETATGLTVPAAMEQIEKTLATWPAQPSAAQRRHLAAYFLAANDRPSARVQWLQLPEAERKIGDGIDEALLKIVSRTGAKPNETYDVAVVLAARLGLNRVYAVDDHTADSIDGLAGVGLETFLKGFWGSVKSPIADEATRLEEGMKTGTDVLVYYRFINRPATQREYVSIDFKAAMNAPSPENYGRMYHAWNETRNLRMVSNIRAAFGNKPGARVLNIVGASHKPYYDAYMNMMPDVKLVDASVILK